MPSRNVVKLYAPNSHYHVYNRGVEKRTIFEGAEDYRVFTDLLRHYLSPPASAGEALPPGLAKIREVYNLHERIRLLAYCLMPNHFHLLLEQVDETAMTELMRRLSNAYVSYFNRRYVRVGPLFQGPYRAVRVARTEQLLYLTRYIHRNPLGLPPDARPHRLQEHRESSYANYLAVRTATWVHPERVLEHFADGDYRAFVELDDSPQPKSVRDLHLD